MAAPVGPKKVHRYTVEFKIQAVRLSLHPEIQTQDVAHALDIHAFMLSRWKKDYREGKLKPAAEAAGLSLPKIRKSVSSRRLPWGLGLLLVVCAHHARPQASGDATYADLAPILAERCVVCHSGDGAPAGLRLDTFDALLKGGLKGPVVRAGDPSNSELIRRIKGVSQPRMPMTGPPFLSPGQIALFERWVAAGLPRGEARTPGGPAKPAPPRPAAGGRVTYAHVAQIFATRCAKCHTDNGLMGPAPEGYRLTSYQATLATADRARVVPGRPDASELVRRIRGQARPRMPLDGPPYLADDDIRLIEDWIAQGARNAEDVPAAVPAGAAVRLHGTLSSRWQLDGLPLEVGARTRIDRAPGPGDYVEVRGRLDESGGVRVERLRRR
jgi:mono/diheme cytochrome c family protein